MSSRTRLFVRSLERRITPTTFTVMNTNDAGSGSLRQAVLDANAAAGADSIEFDGMAFAAMQTITLTTGEMKVTDGFTITGPNARLTIDANHASRIFAFNIEGINDQTIIVNALTLTNGKVVNSGGGAIAASNKSLTLSDITVTSSEASQSGGAISYASFAVGSSMDVIDCKFVGNSATVNVNSCGGAIFAVSFSGTVSISRTTMSGNSAVGAGGGIYFGHATLTAVPGNNNLVGVANTSNASFTGSDNLSGTSGTPLDPLLGPLGNNGGPTLTQALLLGSPALDKGSNPTSLLYDQRGLGFTRKSGSSWDIGAFEAQVPLAASVQTNDGTSQRSMVTSFTVTFNDAVTFPSGIAAAIQLQRTGPVSPTGQVNLAFSQTGNTITVTFDDPTYAPAPIKSLIDGNYTLTLVSNKIQGAGGFLDGDNNGTAGGDFILNTHRLFGDADGNATVNSNDFAIFRSFFGTTNGLYFDANNDGVINSDDFAEFRKRFGITLMP